MRDGWDETAAMQRYTGRWRGGCNGIAAYGTRGKGKGEVGVEAGRGKGKGKGKGKGMMPLYPFNLTCS